MRKIVLSIIAILAFSIAAIAQNMRVTGTVTDAEGTPQIGATVIVKGTSNAVATGTNGEFALNNVPSDATLVISLVGMVTEEVPVAGKTRINVQLQQDTQAIEDVLVVAFGTAKKEAFTGSAAVMGAEDLAKSQVSSVTNALSGAVAGVQLRSSNGAPGSTSTIRVRGFSSIAAGNDPLIIVDGAPYSGDIANINPSDVESMTILKDAASNALYGARGANGVIMITTKRAKRGEAKITVDAKMGVNTNAMRNYNMIKDPALYYETHYKAMVNYYQETLGLSATEANLRANANIGGDQANAGLGYITFSVPDGESLIGVNGKMNPNATLGRKYTYQGEDYWLTPDNWEDYGYREGVRQEYNVSVAAGNERSSFYASVAYLDNQGITENSDMTRLTARLRADYQAKKWFKIGGNMSYSKFNYNTLSNNGSSTSTGNVWAFTSQIAPIYPLFIRKIDATTGQPVIYVDDNNFEVMDYGDGANAGLGRPFLSDANALMQNKLNTNNSEGNGATGNGFADINLFPTLKLTVNGTYNLDETRYNGVLNPYYGQFAATGGTVEKAHYRTYDYNLQQILNYNETFGRHNVNVMAGHEYYNYKYYYLYASKSKMFSQANKELAGAVVDGQSANSYTSEYNNEGYFARLQYDYDSRIFLSGSFRRDASSRFAPENRWGNFWSAGAAWLVSKESWFNAPWVSELKLKASVGSQGNDNISSYLYTDQYAISNSSGDVATYFSSKGSRNITWETNTNFNIGTEFTLFQDRLRGSIDYFYRKTTDMLFSFPVAPSMGYSSYYANVGDMYNKGIELELGATIYNSRNINWDVNFNITKVKNKITMIDDEKKTKEAYSTDGKKYSGYQSGSNFIAEDLSLYTWYLKDFAGVDHETGKSLYYVDELDSDGNRTGNRTTTDSWSNADYYVNTESGIPDWYGGFGTTVNAYGFDFSINFSYQLGGKAYDNGYAAAMASPTSSNSGYNFHADLLNSWSADNTESNIPRFQFADTGYASTRYLTSASYLNIENINFGYTFPRKWTEKILVNTLRIYLSCENVWYWSARQGLDSRQSYSGSTGQANYSPMRTISGGITVQF